MLYASVGSEQQAGQEFEAEKALFPESASYMDFLMKKKAAPNGAATSAAANPAPSAPTPSAAGQTLAGRKNADTTSAKQ